MEQGFIGSALAILTAVGTFCTGIAALVGVFKFLKNAVYQNEVLYGEEAEERFRKIEHTLPQARFAGNILLPGEPQPSYPSLK